MLFREMTRAEIDTAYNNTKAVHDSTAVFADFRARSVRIYDATQCQRNLQYGSGSRERFDLFRVGKMTAPTAIYIHGGYWQTLAKEDFAFIAQGPLDMGYNVILAEYSLAPEASMTQIVEEIGRLLEYISANTALVGVNGGPVSLIGHSAGGHLALLHRSHPLVDHVMAISPLVDLEPISMTWLNEKLNLTEGEIQFYSPIRHVGGGAPTTVAVGTNELPELVRHACDYAVEASKTETVEYVGLDHRNHFTVLEDLANAAGPLAQILRRHSAQKLR